MPKSRVSSVIDNRTAIAFRTWVQMVESLLVASGLVRTTDAGQIVVSTATLPASGAAAGYSMFRFNDPLQATVPVFVKVEYGTSTNSSSTAMWVTVGQGSDGAGNITGALTSRTGIWLNSTNETTVRESLAVHNNWGAALIVGAVSATASSNSLLGFGFAIQRTCESNGAPSADGLLIHFSNTTNSALALGAVTFAQLLPSLTIRAPAADTLALLPMGLTDYMVGTSPQVFPTWCALPKVRPMNFVAVGPANSSPGVGQTFTMAIVGTQARTYICVGAALSRCFYPQMSGTAYLLWED